MGFEVYEHPQTTTLPSLIFPTYEWDVSGRGKQAVIQVKHGDDVVMRIHVLEAANACGLIPLSR